jgi:hypothetical protein
LGAIYIIFGALLLHTGVKLLKNVRTIQGTNAPRVSPQSGSPAARNAKFSDTAGAGPETIFKWEASRRQFALGLGKLATGALLALASGKSSAFSNNTDSQSGGVNMTQGRVTARRSKPNEDGDESLAAIPQRAAARAPAMEETSAREVKLDADTEVNTFEITDTVGMKTYEQTTYTDSKTAETYLEEGRPEPSRKGFTIRHEFSDTLLQFTGQAPYPKFMTDMHGVEVFFDGSVWSLARFSYGHGLVLGKTSSGGNASVGDKIMFPNGCSLQIKSIRLGGPLSEEGFTNPYQVVVDILDPSGQVKYEGIILTATHGFTKIGGMDGSPQDITITVGARGEAPIDESTQYLTIMDITAEEVEFDVYSKLVALIEPRPFVGGEIGEGEEAAFPNGYTMRIDAVNLGDGTWEGGSNVQINILNPDGMSSKSAVLYEGEKGEIVLPDGNTYWIEVRDIDPAKKTLDFSVYKNDPSEAEPLEDGSRVKLEWSPDPDFSNQENPTYGLDAIEVWSPRTKLSGTVTTRGAVPKKTGTVTTRRAR